MNRFYGGEAWHQNASGLPQKANNSKQVGVDYEWWLRNNDRSRVAGATGAEYSYFPVSSCVRKDFGANGLGDHSRRVFTKLARQGHSFSEGNLQAFRRHPEVRRDMARRYEEMMARDRPFAPLPQGRPERPQGFPPRERPSPAPPKAEARRPARKLSSSERPPPSVVSVSTPSLSGLSFGLAGPRDSTCEAKSSLSAMPPASVLSAATASQLPEWARPAVPSHISAAAPSQLSAAAPSQVSAAAPSQLLGP